MGGHGNKQDVFCIAQEVVGLSRWQRYFDGFNFPVILPARRLHDAARIEWFLPSAH
jgi:hypothetical protein